LSDNELGKLVSSVSEAWRRLRVVADVIDEFDQFCRSHTTKQILGNIYPNLQLPTAVGPIDRAILDKLEVKAGGDR